MNIDAPLSHNLDGYEYWRAACAAVRTGAPLPPIRDGAPQYGYYFFRRVKDGPKLPIAIFDLAGLCSVLVEEQSAPASEHNRLWLICARHPVDYESYCARMATGCWPGETAPPRDAKPGDNSPPPEAPDAVLTRALDAGEAFAATDIDSDAKADEAANRAKELHRLREAVKDQHKQEKEPHLTACNAIDERFRDLIRDGYRCDLTIKRILSKLNDWTNKKKAAAAAKEAAERAAAEAARPSTPGPVVPPPTAPPPPVKHAYGGITGNKISQRTVPVAAFDGPDGQDKCYAHFRGHPDVQALLLKLAQAIVKAKLPAPPGIRIEQATRMQ